MADIRRGRSIGGFACKIAHVSEGCHSISIKSMSVGDESNMLLRVLWNSGRTFGEGRRLSFSASPPFTRNFVR